MVFGHCRRQQAAFTLVELLVVIAIIGILVALLLPAVQAAREAGRRASCSNNLKQLGIAMHSYHDVLKTFPSAYVLDIAGGTREAWGWSALLLPYLEQESLHASLGVVRGSFYQRLVVDGAVVVPLAKSNLKPFRCPSDAGFTDPGLITSDRDFSGGLGFTAAGQTAPPGTLVGVSNYPAIAGHIDGVGSDANTGVFFGNSGIGMAEILDGTSNTLLVGERETENCRSGTWVGVRNPPGSAAAGANVVLGHSQPKLNSPIAWNTAAQGCMEGFSSFHPGGAQFLQADGAVRFISNSIQHRWYAAAGPGTVGTRQDSQNAANGAYQRLMTRDDGLDISNY